jgi:hypothetical protein
VLYYFFFLVSTKFQASGPATEQKYQHTCSYFCPDEILSDHVDLRNLLIEAQKEKRLLEEELAKKNTQVNLADRLR